MVGLRVNKLDTMLLGELFVISETPVSPPAGGMAKLWTKVTKYYVTLNMEVAQDIVQSGKQNASFAENVFLAIVFAKPNPLKIMLFYCSTHLSIELNKEWSNTH